MIMTLLRMALEVVVAVFFVAGTGGGGGGGGSVLQSAGASRPNRRVRLHNFDGKWSENFIKKMF